MAVNIPTTQELTDRNKAIFDAILTQTIPAIRKAYYYTMCIIYAMIETELTKKLVDDARQNLAISATDGLEKIGGDRGIVKTAAVAFVGTGTLPATTGVIITATRSFIGEDNGIQYFMTNSVTSVGGIATIQVTAEQVGISGNLIVGAKLKISSAVAGAGDTLTITIIDTIGAAGDSQETFRQEILEDQRQIKGGGNNSDYRRWSKVVAGVVQSFPYSGLPFGDIGTPAPPDRTIYILADTGIDPDGIAPTTLLDSVRAAINNDTDTGIENMPLGINDSTLYVESIRRTEFYIEISDLVVPATEETAIKTQIESTITSFLYELDPFVEGLDFALDRNDIITDPILNRIIQDIIDPFNGTFSGTMFGLAPSVFIDLYVLGAGETAKIAAGGFTYV